MALSHEVGRSLGKAWRPTVRNSIFTCLRLDKDLGELQAEDLAEGGGALVGQLHKGLLQALQPDAARALHAGIRRELQLQRALGTLRCGWREVGHAALPV